MTDQLVPALAARWRMATADRAGIVAIMRREAEESMGGDLGVSETAMVCRLAGITGLHALLDSRGWTVLAISPTLRRESTRPTLRQALACALLPHLEAMP